MKTTSRTIKYGLGALAAALLLTATSALWADDDHGRGEWDGRHHYRRDNYGYYDGDRYHHYVNWHEHHGYWDERGSTRVFINVD
jgi:hypothetical protein